MEPVPSQRLSRTVRALALICLLGCSTTVFSASSSSVSATSHPLVARYTYVAPQSASVYVEFGEDTHYGRRTSTYAYEKHGPALEILVAGMKASTTYHMRAVAQLLDGSLQYDADRTFTTSVPDVALPTIHVTHTSLTPAAGVEFMDLVSPDPAQPSRSLVTDLDGNVIWYYPGDADVPTKLLANGHLLLVSDFFLREVDLTGATVRKASMGNFIPRITHAEPGPGAFHHDFALLPNGHTVFLTQVYETVPTSDNPSGDTVVDNGLIDIDENWRPTWVWHALDHLDVNRHPWWGLPDWLHSNAVVYDPRDHNLIVSVRHQNWVIKIDYRDGAGTGNVLWKLGYQGDFTLIGGGNADWFWAQHDPTFTSFDGPATEHMAIFDNGDFRTNDVGQSCGRNNGCYSRGVVLQLDEAAKTAQVVYEDRLPYASWGGSAVQLSNGDLEFAMSPLGRVVEVTHDPAPQIVWQLDINQFTYRSQRIPSLYPGVSW